MVINFKRPVFDPAVTLWRTLRLQIGLEKTHTIEYLDGWMDDPNTNFCY